MSLVPEDVREGALKALQHNLSGTVAFQSFTSISGGCINHGGRFTTSSGVYFLKWNSLSRYPNMFATEARGLALLGQAKSIYIPDVIATGETDEHQFLLLEFIEAPGAPSKSYWNDFGQQLARLHQTSAASYGLDHDNYIGSIQQINSPSHSWIEFFIHQRLQVQLQFAVHAGHASSALQRDFETLYTKLPALLPEEKPSLIHGDLWSGNILTHASGSPCLIDPAVYFGHREIDLAMTQLFGGFDGNFLDAYGEVFPLVPGFDKRVDLYNLYPLLVHVNLFGVGYLSSVNSILQRFI